MKALNELVITYADENRNTKIRANLICPKGVNTYFRDKIMPGENKNDLLTIRAVAEKILEISSKNFKETGVIIEI